jgi:CRISPR-associated protein Csy1
MLDPAISDFFEDRKEAWLKKKIKSSMQEDEIKALEIECNEAFSLEEWLPNAARRSGQISIATHPCTFSHPSARKNKNGYVSSIIAKTQLNNDGFLKTGNVTVETDALGNAAALDVYKFLTLQMEDKASLLEHIQQDSGLASQLLKINSATYQQLKDGFLAMVESSDENITSSKIKQVYFPMDDNYHQLSILTNSGLMYQLRARIDHLRFSDEVKQLREIKRTNEFSTQGFSEIYNLTTIAYGGTKPQNISVLNNKNGGKVHLLQSLPPSTQKRNIHFPKTNFFTESFRYRDYRDVLQALHKILKTNYNNINIREGRDYRIQELMDRLIDKMWAVRSISNEQYHPKTSKLKPHQKIWLCEEMKQEREESDIWLDKLVKEISSWVIRSYEKVLGKQAIKLGKEELQKIAEIVEKNKEALR